MQPATSNSELIADSPCFIKAWLTEDKWGTQLTVYRSVLVHDDDQPQVIKEMLNTRPHRVVLAEVVEDDNMMFGEGVLSVYRFQD